jgi:hypothetical protein
MVTVNMSNSELWSRASELYAARGSSAKLFALRQAIRAKWNDDADLFDDWLIVASRISIVSQLH